MRLCTLGKLELEGSNFTQAKALLLLAYLAVEGPQERRRLAELFWFRSAGPLNNLGTTLTRIRKGASGVVERNDIQVWTSVECDAVELLQAHKRGDAEACAALYEGAFLGGVRLQGASSELEEWFYTTRESLGARVRQALLDLAEGRAGVGEFELAAEKAQRAYLLPGAPEPEPGELERLFTLLQAGGHGEAFEVRREALGYDLDFNLSIEGARAALYKGRGTAEVEVRHNLPIQPTQFVGREAEKAKLGELLLDPACRLLTIVGPGGFGKTRLAIEVATSQRGSFPDGVFFIPFAPVTSSTSIPYAIADALGLGPSSLTDVNQQLLEYLKERRALLVLDNLEHLLDGIGLVHDIWEQTRNVKLLVTSRERLNLRAEQVHVLKGLSSPDEVPIEQSDAVELFLQAARIAGHEVVLSEDTAQEVARICQLMGGMPLAIELAAVWLHVLPLGGIVEQLAKGLDLLEGSTRDVPTRHSSIRAVFDYSWELLSEVEREVLRRLAVFEGGFSLRASTEVAEASLPVLARLGFTSFLMLTPAGRYEKHPLVLEYARERLAEQPGERSRIMERHGKYYLTLLQEHYLELSSSTLQEPRTLLEAELPNIRVAWDWAIGQQRLEMIRDSAFPLHKLLEVLGRDEEAVELFSRAAASLDQKNPEHHGALGRVLIGRGAVHKAVGGADKGRSLFGALELLRPLGDDLGVAWVLSWLVVGSYFGGDEVRAREYHQEGFPLARRVESPHLIGRYLNTRVILDEGSLGLEEARKLHEHTLREQREAGDFFSLIYAMVMFGVFLTRNRFFDEGKALLTESLELARDYQFVAQVVHALHGLTEASLATGDLDEAESFASELLQDLKDYGLHEGQVDTRVQLGLVATRRGNLAQAEEVLFEALRIARGLGIHNLILVALLGMAELRIAQGREEASLGWLGLIINHQATRHFDRAGAQRLLANLRLPEDLAAAVSGGKELTLEGILAELLPPT